MENVVVSLRLTLVYIITRYCYCTYYWNTDLKKIFLGYFCTFELCGPEIGHMAAVYLTTKRGSHKFQKYGQKRRLLRYRQIIFLAVPESYFSAKFRCQPYFVVPKQVYKCFFLLFHYVCNKNSHTCDCCFKQWHLKQNKCTCREAETMNLH